MATTKPLKYYRGCSFLKSFVVKFLRSIFYAEQKGALVFFDGTKEISFSDPVHVEKTGSWDYRNVPAVLIGATRGTFIPYLNKDLVNDPDETETKQSTEFGGDIDLSLSIEVLATSLEERDNLLDIVSIYLSHPDAKDYFLKQNLRFRAGVTISEGGTRHQPDLQQPVYYSTIDVDISTSWRAEEEVGSRLADIIVDIDLEEEL